MKQIDKSRILVSVHAGVSKAFDKMLSEQSIWYTSMVDGTPRVTVKLVETDGLLRADVLRVIHLAGRDLGIDITTEFK